MNIRGQNASLADRDQLLLDLHARHSALGIVQRRVRLQYLSLVWRGALALSGCAKRLLDVSIAMAVLITLSPFFFLVAVMQRVYSKPMFTLEPRVGRWNVPFAMFGFYTDGGIGLLLDALKLHKVPSIINVIRGDMSLIGPRAARPDELDSRERAVWKRSSIRPGLVSLWWIRERANIAFGTELEIDQEYVDGQSVRGDLGIAFRALPSLFYGRASSAAPERVSVLGISLWNITMEEALDYILAAAAGNKSQQLCFVNTDCVNKAQTDLAYAKRLNSVEAVLADGIGIRVAGKITQQEIRQNVNGTDLFPLLCQRLQSTGAGMFLLGGRPGVAEDVAAWIDRNYPGATVMGTHHGYFAPEEEAAVLRTIRASGARILLVAFGSPRQDMWIGEHLVETGVGIAMGVGGLFDFYSGRIPRAPQWLRELSLEWVFRLCQEPSRMWKRYLLGNIIFLSRVGYDMMRKKGLNRS